jgi:molybdopterin-synthase adenylyltransferase
MDLFAEDAIVVDPAVVEATRDIRQAEIVPARELAATAAVVVGCGAIGSFLARNLAHLGVAHITLIDPDVVSIENLSLQGFSEDDLGRSKVLALRHSIAQINSGVHAHCWDRPFELAAMKVAREHRRVAVFCCVDDIEVRAAIHGVVRRRCTIFVDGRMAALVWRVLTVDDWDDDYYETTLFRKSEANVLRCTAKGTVFTAAMPAAQMGTQLMLHIKGAQVADGTLRKDIVGNLFTTTLEAT